MKKLLFILSFAALFIAGCGKQEKPNVATGKSPVDEKKIESKKVVTVVVQKDVQTVKWFEKMKTEYEKAYTDRELKLNIIGGSTQNYYTKLMLLMKSDSSVDVIYEDSFMLYSDVSAGLLAPINGVNKWDDWENFYQSLRDFATVDGKIYGIPLSTDSRGLFYNTNIFKKAGIQMPWQPKNWQDIIDTCQIIKEKVPEVAPITISISQAMGEATTMQTLEMLLYGTDSPFYKNGKWFLSTPGMLNSFKFIQTLAKNGYLPRLGNLMNPQYGNIMQAELAPKEQVAIILDGCWISGRWSKEYPETLNIYKMVMMPTEFGQEPKYVSMAGGWLLSINAKSKNKEAAFDFIKFALGKENNTSYVNILNNLTVREDVAKSSKYPAHLKPATDILKYAHFRPANEQYPIVSSKIQVAVESVATQTATPEAALKTLNENVERAIGNKFVGTDKK